MGIANWELGIGYFPSTSPASPAPPAPSSPSSPSSPLSPIPST
ncbi:hypothetical protein [Nostoc favosum]|nr:hypothetical protein [Nostoc favosum]